jgi:hypothetical protein
MRCRFRVRMQCPVCRRVFCVPVDCQGEKVWHDACGAQLVLVSADVDVCDRADVCRSFVRARNEVRPRGGG